MANRVFVKIVLNENQDATKAYVCLFQCNSS